MMLEESRLLDPSNKNDVIALRNVLDHFIEYEKQNKFRLRTIERNIELTNFVKDKFNTEHANDLFIGAAFDKTDIVDVFVGFKLHVFNNIRYNFNPVWFQSIWYSTHRENKSPEQKKTNVGLLVAKRMEQDGYYTWYNSIKFPNYTTEEQCINFVNNFVEKNFNQTRYTTTLEYIFWKDQKLEDIPFTFYRNIFTGVTQNRNMCILSHSLKPEFRKFLR